MSAVSSSFKRTAKWINQGDLTSPTVNDRIWKHCKHQARRLVSKIIKLCSASRTTFRAWFYEQIPKILKDNSEHFQAFWETLFVSERAKKSPEMYFRPKSFRTIFEKRTPVYSFAAPLLGLAKSIYYLYPCSLLLNWTCINSFKTTRGTLSRLKMRDFGNLTFPRSSGFFGDSLPLTVFRLHSVAVFVANLYATFPKHGCDPRKAVSIVFDIVLL